MFLKVDLLPIMLCASGGLHVRVVVVREYASFSGYGVLVVHILRKSAIWAPIRGLRGGYPEPRDGALGASLDRG